MGHLAGINFKRVLIGGLAAGLLYDAFEVLLSPLFLGGQYEAELNAIRHTQPSVAGYAFFIAWGFVIGIIAVCLYAAVRPRFGPGPRTAARVAIALWVIGDLMPQMGQAVMGIFTFNLMLKFTAQQLFFMLATTIFGAWLYREEAAT
jgi:hypothetical protein